MPKRFKLLNVSSPQSSLYSRENSKQIRQRSNFRFWLWLWIRCQLFRMVKYDKFHFPEYPTGKFDTIFCFYVLNVLDSQRKRDKVLKGLEIYWSRVELLILRLGETKNSIILIAEEERINTKYI